MWEPGTKLTVKFLDKPVPASDYVKGKIKQYAEQWKEFANIEFVWIKDNKQDAVVRISFEDDGMNSYLRAHRVLSRCLALPLSLY